MISGGGQGGRPRDDTRRDGRDRSRDRGEYRDKGSDRGEYRDKGSDRGGDRGGSRRSRDRSRYSFTDLRITLTTPITLFCCTSPLMYHVSHTLPITLTLLSHVIPTYHHHLHCYL